MRGFGIQITGGSRIAGSTGYCRRRGSCSDLAAARQAQAGQAEAQQRESTGFRYGANVQLGQQIDRGCLAFLGLNFIQAIGKAKQG